MAIGPLAHLLVYRVLPAGAVDEVIADNTILALACDQIGLTTTIILVELGCDGFATGIDARQVAIEQFGIVRILVERSVGWRDHVALRLARSEKRFAGRRGRGAICVSGMRESAHQRGRQGGSDHYVVFRIALGDLPDLLAEPFRQFLFGSRRLRRLRGRCRRPLGSATAHREQAKNSRARQRHAKHGLRSRVMALRQANHALSDGSNVVMEGYARRGRSGNIATSPSTRSPIIASRKMRPFSALAHVGSPNAPVSL